MTKWKWRTAKEFKTRRGKWVLSTPPPHPSWRNYERQRERERVRGKVSGERRHRQKARTLKGQSERDKEKREEWRLKVKRFLDQWHSRSWESPLWERRGRANTNPFPARPLLQHCVALQEFTSRWCHVHKTIMSISYAPDESAIERGRLVTQTGCWCDDGILTHFRPPILISV